VTSKQVLEKQVSSQLYTAQTLAFFACNFRTVNILMSAHRTEYVQQWFWLNDDNVWTPYDQETNQQIETAYKSNVGEIKLNKGAHFGKYENQNYVVCFEGNSDPPFCFQQNLQTNASRPVTKQQVKSSESAHQEIHHKLTNIIGCKQSVTNKAIAIFNRKYNNIRFHDINYAVDSLIEIIKTHKLNPDRDEQETKTDSRANRTSKYEVGQFIEVLSHGVWTPAEIIKSAPWKSNFLRYQSDRARILTVSYQDTKSGRTVQRVLNGFKDANEYRVLGSGCYQEHSFSFRYDGVDRKRHTVKKAKHPAAYINGKCRFCKGTGIKYGALGDRQWNCKGTGIYHKAFSLQHDKCNGRGCGQCNDTGRYPLYDWKCKGCTACDKLSSSQPEKNKCKECVFGFYIAARPKQFTPERKQHRAHGNPPQHNVMRLYHATNKVGADGIIETGIMMRGQNGSYGGAIYFSPSAQATKKRARECGYLVMADVYVGKTKVETNVAPDMYFQRLNAMGYDSIRGSWNQEGDEYVVYNWDQVWVYVVIPFEKVDWNLLP